MWVSEGWRISAGDTIVSINSTFSTRTLSQVGRGGQYRAAGRASWNRGRREWKCGKCVAIRGILDAPLLLVHVQQQHKPPSPPSPSPHPACGAEQTAASSQRLKVGQAHHRYRWARSAAGGGRLGGRGEGESLTSRSRSALGPGPRPATSAPEHGRRRLRAPPKQEDTHLSSSFGRSGAPTVTSN